MTTRGDIQTWEIVSLRQDRIPEALSILIRVFMPDPIFSHYFTDDGNRAAVFRAFFNDLLHSHLRFGHVYGAVMKGRIVGAAVWRPPDAGEPTASDRRRAAAAEEQVRKIDPYGADNLLADFARLEEQHPSEPHWYLFFIGVEPELQGRGIGSALLLPALARADEARVSCYLETPFPRTHAFYRALGYKIIREGNPFPGAPKVWAMQRSPS